MGGPALESDTASSPKTPDLVGQAEDVSGDQTVLAVFERLGVTAARFVAYHYPIIGMYALCTLGLLFIYGITVAALVDSGTTSPACRNLRLLYTTVLFIVVIVRTLIAWS